MKVTRRQFLGAVAVGATVAACGGDDPPPDAPGQAQRNCAMNGTNETIENNHGHTITVTASDVAGGVDKTYDITGTAGHPHMVTITAANFATLQSNANGSIMVTSTSDGTHTHDVRIVCA